MNAQHEIFKISIKAVPYASESNKGKILRYLLNKSFCYVLGFSYGLIEKGTESQNHGPACDVSFDLWFGI